MPLPHPDTPKLLCCIAPDGEHQTEGRPHDPYPSTESAWNRSNDMGSRWFFYPIHVVTSTGKIIADVPHGMSKEWIGRRLATLCKAIAAHSEHACDYINGKTPFEILP